MEKLKRFLTLLDKTADKIVYFIGGTGLVVCTGMCCANIFMWWFMGRRIAVNDEIALSGLVWATYIGMGLLFKNKAHCTMDFVVDALPPKAKTFVRIITDIAILVIACITVYFSWKLAAKSFVKKLALTKLPYFYLDISVTLGYGHLAILAFADMIQNIMKLIHWKEEVEA